MILKTLVVGKLKSNCFLVGSEAGREAIVIDPGGDADAIIASIGELSLRVMAIVLTHFHFDHVLAVQPVQQATKAPIWIHTLDAPHLARPPELFRFFAPDAPRGLAADRLLEDGDRLAVGTLDLQVLHTPGHSPGGIALWSSAERVVFVGDVLFAEGVGRTDFPGGSHEELLQSITQRLWALPDDTTVYPGHGPATTIGHEKRHNPWVSGAH